MNFNSNTAANNNIENTAKNFFLSELKQVALKEFYTTSPVLTGVDDDKYYSNSFNQNFINAPTISNFVFLAGSYVDNAGKTIEYEQYQNGTVLINVSGRNIINRTQLIGADYSVLEYITKDNFAIDVTMLVTNRYSNERPIESLQNLVKIFTANTSIKIKSDLLEQFNIFNVVIDSYRISDLQGFTDTIRVDFNCISDTSRIIRKRTE